MNRSQIEDILQLPPAERAELETRWLDFQQHPDEGESWDAVEKALRSEGSNE